MKWKEVKRYKDNIEKLKKMNIYEILEINSNASKFEIKKAYLKKIKTYHPDSSDDFVKNNFEEITKIINDSYDRIK